MKRKLTKEKVDALKPSERDVMVWDAQVSGFGVRCRPSGHKYFFLKYRTKTNRQRWYSIGRYGSPWTVDTARDKALKVLMAVKDGKDPAGIKEIEKEIPTVAGLCGHYLNEVEKGHILTKFGTPKKESTLVTDKIRIENYIKPLLGPIRLDALTKIDIERFVRQVKDGKGLAGSHSKGGPGAASRTVGLLGGILSYAIKEGYIQENPVRGVEKPKDKKMERYLTTEELSRLGAVLEKTKKNVFAVNAIRLLIFTGCRKSEILKLRWDHVDFEKTMVFLSDSKTGAKVIYLSAPALEVLSQLEKLKMKKNPYVICGEKPGHHWVNLSRIWRQIRKEAGLEGVRLHDLRHSYASVAATGGIPLQIIGKLLGHSQTATTERYAHLSADPIRAANEAIALKLQGALAGKKGKVISLEKAKTK